MTHVEGKVVHFKDGSTAEVDAIIFCTGYLNHFPFLDESIRLRSPNTLYPHKLYKGTVYTEGGNNRVMYIGIQDQYYTFTMFDVQSLWALDYVRGKITLPGSQETMRADWKKWLDKLAALKDCHDEINFQTDFVMDLAKDTNYKYNLDVGEIFHSWEHDKDKDILTYRDVSFASKFTGNQSPIHHSTFMSALDDSMATFLSTKK